MTAFLIVFSTQALDALALPLALGRGHEANPLMSAILAAGGIGALLAVKLGAGAVLGAGVARVRPSWRRGSGWWAASAACRRWW